MEAARRRRRRGGGTLTDIVERVCAAYAWQRALGNHSVRDGLCRVVTDRAHPDVWDANHVSEVRAGAPADIERVLRRADEALAHCGHRMFVVDPLTPAAFNARLALDDYRELDATLQLVLAGPLRADPRPCAVRPVQTEVDWQSLHALLREDHAEGGRTHGGPMPEHVTEGMIASYRSKAPAYQFFLASEGGVDCAYGAGVLCENGLGMVEDLFTLPAFRRRGIATAIIARAVAHARERGADEILIGAHTADTPKLIYAALGFAPVCLTREYIKSEFTAEARRHGD